MWKRKLASSEGSERLVWLTTSTWFRRGAGGKVWEKNMFTGLFRSDRRVYFTINWSRPKIWDKINKLCLRCCSVRSPNVTALLPRCYTKTYIFFSQLGNAQFGRGTVKGIKKLIRLVGRMSPGIFDFQLLAYSKSKLSFLIFIAPPTSVR